MNLLNHTPPHGMFLTLCACLALAACRQPAELKFPAALDNQITRKHVQIPETGISIILPEDFTYWNAETQSFGNRGKDTCMILFREVRFKNYYEWLLEFRPAYEEVYLSVAEETHLTISGFPATILFIHQDSRYDGYHILFGDSTFAAFIMTVQPNTAYRQKEKIFKSLTTVLYDKKQ
jgi:hypothetical protein